MVPEGVRSSKQLTELRCLPTFDLRVAGQSVPLAHRSQRVLVLLAVRGGPVDRAELAGTLWPDVSASRAYSSLRSTLWGLARLGPSPVTALGTSVQLSPDVRVDVEAARRLAMRIIDRGPGKISASAALATLRHDFLPSWSEDWLAAEQHHFRQLRLHALEVLSRHLSESGDHAHAVEAGLLALAVEPLRESAHRTLMLAHLAEGNRAEAIWQYHRCRELLQTELGLTPSPEMQALLQRALHGPVDLSEGRGSAAPPGHDQPFPDDRSERAAAGS
ncbi:DNA-binding SARP family transcriptional activator [Georgenia soli]|uniref:DNA-binding SARP family transcriptional activator n=1 Tax=Georgenia soli TaxID=638953 RepID=A0A2A9EL86_9MICO|nr:bacterial transcriptional activator domain-containing protein [Georgenia soli]PFG39668.1 DNA-binding SARP family transcriptional activator [Georgenia soli]